MTTKPASKLTFRDRLAHLTFDEACKLLGTRGKKLIYAGGQCDIDIPRQVFLGHDLLRVSFDEVDERRIPVVATITLKAEARNRLHLNCTVCDGPCEHLGAALALVLEEKTSLRLAEPPPEPGRPLDSLPESELYHRALADRLDRAKNERMQVKTGDCQTPWTDYVVTSTLSGKSYRVALRGLELGQSYCSCPDFRANTLGTCKHILHVLSKVRRRFDPRQLKTPYKRRRISVYLKYDQQVTLALGLPDDLPPQVLTLAETWQARGDADPGALVKLIEQLGALGRQVHIYPDAEEYIERSLIAARLANRCAEIRRDPHNHPLRKTLLKVPLLPYQMDGVAFAAGAGRAVLADDMGLGKTIQGVGVAEMLAREAGVRRTLVICPASLKSQWAAEIHRFCDRDVQLVAGSGATRSEQYTNECFYTICNYEQVLRDLPNVEQGKWDLIVLDEGQRIKNWESKTSRVIKCLKSRFALVLSGTPLENRLEELYSVVQFIDDRRLGPGFRFFNQHRMSDETGKVIGYRNLAVLRETLRPVLLRRTREMVKLDVPPRSVEYVRLPPTDEQRDLHLANMKIVAQLMSKSYFTEMDLLRLRAALLNCRMAADSSCLVAKDSPTCSNKLDHLDDFLPRLFEEPDRKALLFSEWTTMLDRIEALVKKHGLPYVRLDGSVPQKQRQAIVNEFQTNPECKLFLTSNAGSTGLNLQAANTVINVDLPWNPAVLEQRIGRAHRMGQTQSVQVFVLVTEQTIEENLLATLSAKRDLAIAALDVDSDVNQVELPSGIQDIKQRLERLLGAKADAPVDQSVQAAEAAAVATNSSSDATLSPQRERVAAAGGELLGAAFKFLGELVSSQNPSAAPAPPQLVQDLRQGLAQCVTSDEQGRQRLTLTLSDPSALDGLAQTLARLLVVKQS